MRAGGVVGLVALGSASVLAPSGCIGGPRYTATSPATFVDEPDVASIEVASAVGEVGQLLAVRAVNAVGAAVPADPVTLTVNGAPVEVAFDGFGYGALPIDTAGHAVIGGAGSPAEAWTFGAGSGIALDPVWETGVTAPEAIVALSTGALASEGDTLWWAGDPAAAHPVLVADSAILGVRSGNIDVDGTLDGIAWTASTVYLLKGRPTGGMAWGGAFRAPGYAVAGADVGDLSADNLPDVAIAWVDASGLGLLDIWEGNGLFEWRAAEPRGTPGVPTGLDIADATGEELAQVTVLQDAGDWARFIRGAELKYMPIGPTAPTDLIRLPPGSVILPSGDVNGDGASEIVLATPRQPATPRSLWLVDVGTDAFECAYGQTPDLQCGTEFVPLVNEIGAYYGVGDGNGDYLADVFLLHDSGALYAVAWDPLELSGPYAKVHALDLPAHGPFDVSDLDRDGGLDVVLGAGPLWWAWHGEGFGDTERFWAPKVAPSTQVREAVEPPIAIAELDADPHTIEVLGFGREGDDVEFRIAQYTPGGGRAPLLGRVTVATNRDPDDLTICGKDVYVVIAGQVQRLDLTDPTHPTVAYTLNGSARRADCGQGPANTDIAVLDDDQVSYRLRATLNRVGDPIDVPGAVDVALGDVGDGPEARVCTDPACTIVFWPSSAGPVFAASDSVGTTVVGPGLDERLAGTGELSLADVDDNGDVDLLSLDPVTGLLALHRTTADGPAKAELFHLQGGARGPVVVRDSDEDGQVDLWWVDRDGYLTAASSVPPVTTP
jgi:hypothetical protein